MKICLVLIFACIWASTATAGSAGPTTAVPPQVAVDVGHTLAEPGASSARGRSEFDFNRELAGLLARLHLEGLTLVLVLNRFDEMARLASLLGRELIPADVVVMSDEAFEQERAQPNTLAWRAAREGRIHAFPQ